MTFCYWGGNCGAKIYVRKLLTYNSKEFVRQFDYVIDHHQTICHWTGKNLDSNSIWDITTTANRIHRHIDNPQKLFTVSQTSRRTEYLTGGIQSQKGTLTVKMGSDHHLQFSGVMHPISAIIPDELVRVVRLRQPRGFGKYLDVSYNRRQIEEFSSLNYKGTSMYHDIIDMNKNNNK